MEKDTNNSRKAKETSEEKKALLTEDSALGDIASEKIFEDDPELAKELAEDRKIQEKAREYKALQEARKRRRRKRLLIALLVLIAIGTASYLGYEHYQKVLAEQNSEAQVIAQEGQEIVYAEIESIVGNNISVSILSEAGDSADNTDNTDNTDSDLEAEDPVDKDSSESTDEQDSEGKEAGQQSMDEGPGMNGGSGPDTESSVGTKMNGGSGPDMGSTDGPQMGGASGQSSGSSMMAMGSQDSGSSYVSTGETAEYQIPVGTVIITKLGTSATFTSLSTGDVIAIAVEEGTDVIDKIWIVE